MSPNLIAWVAHWTKQLSKQIARMMYEQAMAIRFREHVILEG